MRILIIDDHDLVRETIASFLMQAEETIEVETASNIENAIEVIRSAVSFDLILLDFTMPGLDGFDALEKVKSLGGGTPVAILSGTASPTIAKDAIEAGAIGFVPKTLSANSILNAIGLMVGGHVFVPFEFMQQKEDVKPLHNLTKRENEVLQGLAKGKSNKEIARDLELQEVTIKLHVKTLCRKLGVNNRTQAALMLARETI